MANEKSGGWAASLIERAKAVLVRPRETWPEIDRDMTPSGELFTHYAAPLAALAPILGLITGRAFGWNPFGLHFFGQLFTAVSDYAFTLINLLVLSFIAARLAPRFGGEGSPRDAFKLIVYSSTALWLASAVAAIPGFDFLGMAGFYSLFLFFTGIAPIMKVPEVNKGRFGFVTIACAIALNAVTSLISSGPAWLFGSPPAPRIEQRIDQHQGIRIDGEDIDFDPRAFASDLKEAIGKSDVAAVPGAQLQALLPASLGSYERTAVESVSGTPGGSRAEATYEDGGQEFTLKVVDLASFGALAQMGNSFHIDRNREDKDGFERVSNANGTLVVEKWENDADEGRYMTIVDKRFLIEAQGEADSFDVLKRAATNIDTAKLRTLAK